MLDTPEDLWVLLGDLILLVDYGFEEIRQAAIVLPFCPPSSNRATFLSLHTATKQP